MNRKSIINWCINVKPNIVMSFGFVLVIVTGILGEYYSWERLPQKPLSNVFGCIVFIAGWILHIHCHRFHKQAHEYSGQIQNIVNSGPFSIIRHPMYLSLILMYFGLFIAWGIIWMFVPSIFFSLLIIMIALKEEKFLLHKLGSQYEDYKGKVPWRFIPKIF